MKLTADFILNAAKIMAEKGMSLPESIAAFSRDQIGDAMFDESGPMTEDQRALLDLVARAYAEESNERDLGQAIELWMAGWTHEPVTPDSRIMSWYWRSPAKGNRPKGRRYLSTNQAVNALRLSKQKPNETRR